LAYTFGKISPNIKIRKVATTTSNKNRTDIKLKSLILIFENKVSPITLKSSTTPMLMVLLAIRIVANNFLGLSNNFTMILPLAVLSCTMVLISVADKPKKATSAPDIKAEQSNNKNRIQILSIKVLSTAKKFRKKLRGSGSNSY
jgi:hypothetical protein